MGRIETLGGGLLLVLPALGLAQLAPQPYDTGGPLHPLQAAYDVQFYELTLRLMPDQRAIRGWVTVSARAVEELDTLLLNLDPLLTVDSVWVLVSGDTVAGAFVQEGPYVKVVLSGGASAGDDIWARIYYGGQPRPAPSPPWSGGLVWARTPVGRANWLGVACQTEGADVWWPCKDHPSDEPDSVRLHFTVPGDLVCVSNGRFLGVDENPDGTKTYHWFESNPINNYCVTFYAAPFVQLDTSYVSVAGDTIPVTAWVLPEHESAARPWLRYMVRDLAFLESVAGPYPFRNEKYAIAEAPYLGMEHQTIIAYGSNFRMNRYGFDWLHFHELAHEWYGNCATVPDWKDFWIHEGFATYMEALYAEELGGVEAYHAYMRDMRRSIQNQIPLAPAESRSGDQMYSNDLYYKGAWVLHTLRFLIGESRFRTFLRRVVYPDPSLEMLTDGRQCHFVSSEDLLLLLHDITGNDLTWFFDVYLRQPKLPQLQVWPDGSYLRLRWIVPQGLPFPMPVEVKVGTRRYRVSMAGGQGSVRMREGDPFTVDPDGWILMEEPIVGVAEAVSELPTNFELEQNWPNPFNGGTTIAFSLPREERVRLEVFDVRGKRVRLLVDERMRAGRHTLRFDAGNLPSGEYVCRLTVGQLVRTRKMVLLR